MVMIQVQTADEDRLLGAVQLAFDKAIVGTAACFQRQSAISPELALAAEAKRSLHASDQQGSANWSQKGNTGQYRRGGMFAALSNRSRRAWRRNPWLVAKCPSLRDGDSTWISQC